VLIAAGKGVSLRYHKEWLRTGFALSEDLPLIDTEFLPPARLASDAERAVGAVDDARPDRWGEKVIRFLDRPKRLSLMEYLYYAGDERFGALGVSTSATAYSPRSSSPLPRLSQVQHLSEVIAKIEAAEALSEAEARIVRAGGSLGGAKPKALIEVSGEQWVVKFFNGEPIDTPLVEHATMTLASHAGITVAQTQVIHLTGANAIAIRRFDREGDLRVHSISAGTAIRAATASGSEPDLGYPELARIIRRIGVTQDNINQRDARELFRRMTFNILIDNTDDHEKNHVLVVSDAQTYELSPAFDVLPSGQALGIQQMRVGTDAADSTLENALSEATAFALSKDAGVREVRKIVAVVDRWIDHFKEAGVSRRDIASLADQIDRPFLLDQRKAFRGTVLRTRRRR